MKINESFFEDFVSDVLKCIRKYSYPLLASIIVGVLTYMFSFTNKLMNLDDIGSLSFHRIIQADHGRWVIDILNSFMPTYSMPWIYGIISIAILAYATCVIIKIFEINDHYMQVLIAGLVISFPSIVGMMSYMFVSYSYSLSFLLSVLSVYFVRRERKKDIALAIVCLVFSMGIYQAYLAVVVTFLMLLVSEELASEQCSLRKLGGVCLRYVLFVAVSAVLYYIITKIVLFSLDIQFNTYTSERLDNSEWGIYPRIYWLIVNLYSCMFYGTYGFVGTLLSKVIHSCLVLFIIIAFLGLLHKNRLKTLYGVILLLLFPFGINCLHLLFPTGTHSLTLLSFISIYVFVVILCKLTKRNLLRNVILLLFSLLLMNNVFIANKVHLKQYIQYEQAFAFYNRVVSRIESLSDVDINSKVAIIGDAHRFVYNFSDFIKDGITGISDESILNLYSRNSFIKYYIGFDIPFATESEIEQIKKSVSYQEMPSYPLDGSVRKIDNFIVVKFD